MPQYPYNREIGGWSSGSESESDSSDDNSTSSNEESPVNIGNTPQESPKKAPATIDQPPLDSPVQEVVVETPDLRSLLHQLVNAGGPPPQQSPSSQHLFKNIGRSICNQQVFTRWLKSNQNDWFLLQTPHGLQNPFFFTSIAACVRSTKPDSQLATVVLGYDNGAIRNHGEHLLASLCCQLLPPDADVEGHLLDITNDLGVAFNGHNDDWRETMLWSLLQTLLTDGSNISWILAINFSPDLSSAASQSCVNILAQLSDLTKATDRSFKILIGFGDHDLTNLGMSCAVMVDLDDEGTREDLLADLESWWDKVVQLRPFLKDPELQKEIRSMMIRHLNQPLLVLSYFQILETRAWISKAQLRADSDNLRSPQRFLDSIWERIPHYDRLFAADALGFLDCCCRPMTTVELATALAAARLTPDSNQLGDDILLDLDYDARYSLAGLIHIEDDRIWLLQPFWACQATQSGTSADRVDSESTNSAAKAPPWLQSRPMAGMKLARACMSYIAVCVTQQAYPTASKRAILAIQWPFLDYAITFWYSHYLLANREGAADEDLRSLIDRRSEILQSWLAIEGSLRFWGLHVDVSGVDPTTTPSAAAMSAKFKIGYPEAISVTGFATRFMSFIDNDECTATIWSTWVTHRPLDISAAEWLQKIRSSPAPASLLKAFRYAPEQTFELLLVDMDFVRNNAKAMLEVAIQQGALSIVEHCLGQLSLHEKLVHELPLASCVRGGYVEIFQKFIVHWTPSKDSLNNGLGNTLLAKAVRYGHLEILDLLLTLDLDVEDTTDGGVLLFAAQTGRHDSLQRLILHKPALATHTVDAGSDGPLHCASANKYIHILASLISSGAPLAAQNHEGETALHIAAQRGHIDVVRLLVQATSQDNGPHSVVDMEEDTMTSPEQIHTRPNGSGPAIFSIKNRADRIPLEDAIENGHEEIITVLLQKTPTEALHGSLLLHTAVKSNNLGTVRQILDFKNVELDIDGKDLSERTALHQACIQGSVEIVRELIGHKANAWTVDDDEYTPFESICKLYKDGAIEIAKILLECRPKDQELEKVYWEAAQLGREKLVTMLLDAGVEKNYKQSDRNSLHAAAYSGHEDVLRVLLMRRVELNLVDHFGDTPIRDAASRDYPHLVKLLLDAGALTNIETDIEEEETEEASSTAFQRGLLYYAATKASYSTVRLLLQMGEKFPSEGDCPLQRLTRLGATSTIKEILEFQKEFEGSALLAECFHIALRNEDSETLSVLLDKKADPNEVSAKKWLGTALHECALYGNVYMARVLLDRPGLFTVNQKAGPLYSALTAAVSWKYPSRARRSLGRKSKRRLDRQKQMVKFLRDRGADPKGSGGTYGTMLNAAAYHGPPGLVEYVLEEVGLEPTMRDHEKRSAMHMACMAPAYSVEKLELLSCRLGVEAMITSRDTHDRTPLHFASGKGALPALQYLLEDSVVHQDLNRGDLSGWTPLHWACRQWDVMAVELLVRNGASTRSTTNNGWTPWDVAVFHGNGNRDFSNALSLGDEDKPTVFERGRRHFADCESCLMVSLPVLFLQ